MAVVLFMRVPELSLERYDLMMAELELDANPPPGAILHIATEAVGSVNVCEVWQTAEAARLRRAQAPRRAGGPPGEGAAVVSHRAAPQSVRSRPRDDQPHRRQLRRRAAAPPLARLVAL